MQLRHLVWGAFQEALANKEKCLLGAVSGNATLSLKSRVNSFGDILLCLLDNGPAATYLTGFFVHPVSS